MSQKLQYKKIEKGEYEIYREGEKIGKVRRLVESEGSSWVAGSAISGKKIRATGYTRSEAVNSLLTFIRLNT